MSHTLAKQDNGQFQLTFTIPKADIQKHYDKALEELSQNVTVEGFRKGKAPIKKVEQQLDQSVIYEKVLQQLLPEIYASAIQQEKLSPIINPQVRLVSAEPNSDWQVEATSTEVPPVDLKDSLTTLKGLLKSGEIWTPEKGKPQTEESEKSQENTEEQKFEKIIKHLVEKAQVDIPDILTQQEADRQLSQLIEHVQKLGLSIEQYLSSTGKDHKALREEYQQRAADELKIEFILGKIAEHEKIEVSDQELLEMVEATQDPQIKQTMEQNPQAKLHLKASLIKRKTFEHLLKLSS